ncbi:Ubiquitin-conjugating enzyme [Macleaya cordata]|uniref:E2 ubiquitin-conjugating enzyme n=1 Tax=Macleaya cordata TaxID=56857 RepID=A0A200Q025_MACCD|nr:Ubiquitin-conjugating enzyme [Macleaya cordata]
MEGEHHRTDANVSEATATMDENKTLTPADCSTNEFSSEPTGNSQSEEAIKQQVVGGSVVNVPYIYRQDVVSPLPADQVRVMWMDHSETTQSIGDIIVVDRGFLHGDIVAAASDPTGQSGIVVDVNIAVDLRAADGSIVKDVSSRDLKRVRDFTVGDHIVLGHWLGRVEDVLDNVTMLFDDGSMCKVVKADPLRLKPVGKNILEDGHFPYYPGQRVRAISSSVFKSAKWLSGLWKASRMEGTVTKVTVGSVFIYWIASASSGYGSESATAPAEEQSPKNLKLLSCFAYANWQVGDWCHLSSPAPLSSIANKNDSSRRLSNDPVEDGLDSGDPESELSTEKYEGNSESMDLDTVPNLDVNSVNVESNASPKSSSCSSSLSVSREPIHEGWPIHRKKMRKVVVRRDKKVRRKEDNFERALVIVNTKTKVDVAWQNGKTEFGLVSTTLIPIDNPGDHEFFAEQYVVEKASDDDDDVSSEVRRVGVVKSVNAKERTATVRWLKPVARPEDPREFDKEEVVSVYELEGHPDYDYCHGDVVVRLSPVSVSSQTGNSGKPVEESERQADSNGTKMDVKKHLRHTKLEGKSKNEQDQDFSDLSWVGNITGLKDGDIEVTWADGMVSTVGPQAIYVVGRDDDEESIGGGSDVSDDDAASWETVNDDEMGDLENAEEEASLQNATDINPEAETIAHSEENSSGRNGPLAIPLAALGFVTRLATGFFSRGRKQIDPLSSDSSGENVPQLQGTIDSRAAVDGSSSSLESNNIGSCGAQTTHADAEEPGSLSEDTDVMKVAEVLCSLRSEEPNSLSMTLTGSSGDDPCSFRHFDTAKDPLDHYYLGESGQNNNGRRWLKKVQQDWTILQKNLPDDIYVRVYEDRMDLIRAVIVGAYGTPYQDGLFVFDFHLPPEYPQVPPSVYYHSGGWRINPNLYEEGKVCLSLLNTWTGRGNEVWDPSSSSILQVLVSLQGLVLNSKPYFNEAGYDKQVGTAEGEKNSLSYNENTFLLNCKSMMYLLRKPPKDFEELVKDHFRRRGHYILKACDAYMKGYLIGSLTNDASISDKSNINSTSVGFKLMLAKIMPKLISALSEVGADCHEFKHLEDS